MKRILRIICLLLSLLVVVIAGAACSTAGQKKTALDPKNPVAITLWHYYVGDNKIALEKAVDEFNKSVGSEKGVVINAVAKGSIVDLEEAITNSAKGVINAEPMPDLFSSYPDKGLEIDQLGKLCDLDDYFTTDEQNSYVDEFLKSGKYDGKRLLSIPIVKSTELLYVNKTAWNGFASQSGLDDSALSTFEGIYDAARAYYQWTDAQTPETAGDGKSLMGFDSVANYIIIGNKQLGTEIIDGTDSKAVLNRTDLKKVFDLYYGGMCLGYFNAVGKFRSDDIKAGDLVAYIGSSSGAAYFPTWIEKDNAQSPIEFLALSYPVFAGGTPTAIEQGAGMSVAKSTPAKEEGSALFLKWFTAKEQNINFAMTTGYLPVEKEAYDNTDFKSSLEVMSTGAQSEKNVAAVYGIALNQIMNADTYATTPFDGSYDLRSILEKSLMTATATGHQDAAAFRAQGMSEQEVLDALNLDARFDTWLASLRSQLDKLGIAYLEE